MLVKRVRQALPQHICQPLAGTSTASPSATSAAKDTASPSVTLPGDKLLPFPGVSRSFYKQQGEIWAKNNSRNLERGETIFIKKNCETIGKCKERNNGTLEENIAELEIAIRIEKRAKRVAELKSIREVAKEIISCLVLPTHRAFHLYWKHKNFQLGTEHKAFYRASDTFDTLSQHLNIAQVIISGKAYLCEASNTDITKLQETLTLMTKEHSKDTFSSEVRKRLNNSFQTALSCLDTKKDRHLYGNFCSSDECHYCNATTDSSKPESNSPSSSKNQFPFQKLPKL